MLIHDFGRRRGTGGRWIIKVVFLGDRGGLSRTRIRIPLDAMGCLIAGYLADPAVTAATVDHDGGLLVERIDGRTLRPAGLTRREVDSLVGGLAHRLGRRPGDRRPIVIEDPEADLAVTALPSDGIVAPAISVARMAAPRLDGWVAAGLLDGADAGQLRELVRNGANLVVAAHVELARRQIVETLLAEAATHGQRVLHVQGHERFHTGMPGLVAIAAPAGGAVCRAGIEALAGRLRPDRLVFPAPTIVTQSWLIDRAAHRRPPCIVSIHARGPGRAAGELERLIGLTPDGPPACAGADLTDAVVSTTAPGAPWRLTEVRRSQRGRRRPPAAPWREPKEPDPDPRP